METTFEESSWRRLCYLLGLSLGFLNDLFLINLHCIEFFSSVISYFVNDLDHLVHEEELIITLGEVPGGVPTEALELQFVRGVFLIKMRGYCPVSLVENAHLVGSEEDFLAVLRNG